MVNAVDGSYNNDVTYSVYVIHRPSMWLLKYATEHMLSSSTPMTRSRRSQYLTAATTKSTVAKISFSLIWHAGREVAQVALVALSPLAGRAPPVAAGGVHNFRHTIT